MITREKYYEMLKASNHPDVVDIVEHLDTLKDLSAGLDHITEMGFRSGTSFTAFLMAQPKKLVTYDIAIPAFVDSFRSICGKTNMEFHQKSTLETEIEETDLLFIDTLHTYTQLKQELTLHAHKAKKYLVFHDTETYGQVGEDGESPGLNQAIAELIAEGHWYIKDIYHNNNGLTVLERKS